MNRLGNLPNTIAALMGEDSKEQMMLRLALSRVESRAVADEVVQDARRSSISPSTSFSQKPIGLRSVSDRRDR
jgi:hypothetical protein